MVKKIFGLVEDYLSLALRVVLTLAIAGILIYSLVSALSGYVMSNKEASLRSGASGAEYADVVDLVFEDQKRVLADSYEEEEEKEEEEIKKVYDPNIVAIGDSMRLHFNEKPATRGRFDDEMSDENLELMLKGIAGGLYSLGDRSRDVYKASCARGTSFPALSSFQSELTGEEVQDFLAEGYTKEDINEYNKLLKEQEREYQRFLIQLRNFWADAEPPADEKSQFQAITSYGGRMAYLWATNDLFLCGWITTQQEIDQANAKAEADAAETRAEGTAKLMAAGASLVAVFAFFATFALVLIAMVLGRIEKRLNK
ncbi:MAG: hypothetical protein CMC48_00255 [Flavobacteriaceae bacterium]|nr:hypothetical protein [Flavobacteriaceae bacterium]|tara:strand:+ start:1047 stop:1985 length:939 start_codon:yes stop_codon:yes gene_type:complete